jgi:hypothetical protein
MRRIVHERGNVLVERVNAGDKTALPIVTEKGKPDFGSAYLKAHEPGIVVRVATGAGAAFVSDRTLYELGYRRVEDEPEAAS